MTSRLRKMAAKITETIQTALQPPAARATNKAKVKESARESIAILLAQKKAEIAQRDAERQSAQPAKRDALR